MGYGFGESYPVVLDTDDPVFLYAVQAVGKVGPDVLTVQCFNQFLQVFHSGRFVQVFRPASVFAAVERTYLRNMDRTIWG